MSDPFTGRPIDDRPYPRWQRCGGIESGCEAMVEVMGPGDWEGQFCARCLMVMAEDAFADWSPPEHDDVGLAANIGPEGVAELRAAGVLP